MKLDLPRQTTRTASRKAQLGLNHVSAFFVHSNVLGGTFEETFRAINHEFVKEFTISNLAAAT